MGFEILRCGAKRPVFVTKNLKPENGFAWQGSYGAFSVSRFHLRGVIGYIETQEQHHAVGTLWANAEEATEFTESAH